MTVTMADFDTIRITAETGAVKHRAACAFEIGIRIGVGRENTGCACPDQAALQTRSHLRGRPAAERRPGPWTRLESIGAGCRQSSGNLEDRRNEGKRSMAKTKSAMTAKTTASRKPAAAAKTAAPAKAAAAGKAAAKPVKVELVTLRQLATVDWRSAWDFDKAGERGAGRYRRLDRRAS